MEGGLVASFEKLVVDVELIQSMAEFLQPLVVDEDTLGFDAM
jgi:trimethylamine--corrinoid protein Co-methyltransferase